MSTILALGLAACSTMSNIETSALAQAPIPDGKARVVITRPSSIIYVGTAATIALNGQTVADIGSGGSAAFDVPAGANVLTSTAWTYPGDYAIKLDAAPGQTYALEVAPREAGIGTAVLFGAIGGAIDASLNNNTGLFEIRAADKATAHALADATKQGI